MEKVVPDIFIESLKEMTTMELVILQKDFRRFPEDAQFLNAVLDELKNRERIEDKEADGE